MLNALVIETCIITVNRDIVDLWLIDIDCFGLASYFLQSHLEMFNW